MTRRFKGIFFMLVALSISASVASADQLQTPYTDPSYFMNVPFGSHSHWAQPWRAYLNTVPASTFVDGVGINFNVDATQAPNVAQMLSRYGIHRARVEFNWGNFDYFNESQVDNATLAINLAALRRNGIRPLILLNANSGYPCPLVQVNRTVTANAPAGATSVTLDDASALVPGYSGLSNLSQYTAAQAIIIGINGNVVTLSQPLPYAISAGSSVVVATLRYKPFSAPGTADYAATLGGWQRYVVNVAAAVRADLGTTGLRDGGFDMEIWNELTFDSQYLTINSYYSVPIVSNPNAIIPTLLITTAATAQGRPDLFSGVQIGDGFANTIPWDASSQEPARLSGIDKHPYSSRLHFPSQDQNGTNLNAAYAPDSYVPTYSELFPEYFGTLIQTETLVRDMGPLTNSLYGTLHGEDARTVNGIVSPVNAWITETGIWPNLDNPAITPNAAMLIKAKTTARYFTFYLNKGATQVDMYAAADSDTGAGIVRDSFLALSEAGSPYPSNEAPYVSAPLFVTGRIMAQMNGGLNRNLAQLRQLQVTSLAAATDGTIFKGDGTSLHPNLRALDVFAFLPYQVNSHKFVIPYYIMTRDVMQTWPQDVFSIRVAGFQANAGFTVYDPFTNQTTVPPQTVTSTGAQLQLVTTDYPKLLIVSESGPLPSAFSRQRSPFIQRR